MDFPDRKNMSSELLQMLAQGSVALSTIQGIELGFFDIIPDTKAITPQELSVQMGFDICKVERWIRFALANGYVSKSDSDNGYTLTIKGSLLRRDTPASDLLGLCHLFSYFTKAVQYSREAYQKGVGLDSITQGKISRDYIPRVASQLSRTLADFFKWSGLSSGHTILDLGCGDGSVLREIAKICPGISATGIDMNLHTLEAGKRENAEAGLQYQIELQVGDITDLSKFDNGVFDWICAINVFHYIPANKRDQFLREMIRISRYGIFFNQVIVNNLKTITTDVLVSTLFTDYTGFFTQAEADEAIKKTGLKYVVFLPIIQDESRMVALYTAKNDTPIDRIPGLGDADKQKLAAANLMTSKDLLVVEPSIISHLNMDAHALRAATIKLLFP